MSLFDTTIKNRKELQNYFDEIMGSSYSSLVADQRQYYEENLVKSYALELHNPKKDNQKIEKLFEVIQSIAEADNLVDEEMIVARRDRTNFYIDYSDKRFLLFHSAGKADKFQNIIEKLVKVYPELDRVWLPSTALEKLSLYGEFESWKSTYDSKKVYSEGDINSHTDLDWEQLSLTIKTRNPREKLEKIRQSKIFEGIMPITGIRVAKTYEDTLAREDISYIGKFTARGNDFVSHLDVLSNFTNRYKQLIEGIEFKYAMRFENHELSGEPIILDFSETKQIAKNYFKLTIENWFNGTQPFLLWGKPTFLKDDYAVVNAIDLHVGHKVKFEISPSFMRIYLPHASCGNVVSRLITNLEQHFHSSFDINNAGFYDVFNNTDL